MATLFNVYLKVHSPRGVFEGRITDDPLEKSDADELMANYMDSVSHAKSLTMPTTEPGSKAMLVFPAEVLNQSVMRFYSMAVMEPAAMVLDFAATPSKGMRVDDEV